jgi:hypothetical protein
MTDDEGDDRRTIMALDVVKFGTLCGTLSEIDLFGTAQPAPPWADTPTDTQFQQAIDSAKAMLPVVYQDAYVGPVLAQIPHILTQPWAAETVAGAVYDHAPGSGVDPQLDRFLAVISNFYRSFLESRRRAKANFPIVEVLPPLATFKYDGQNGPFTIPVDAMNQLCGAAVGVVSLPSTYRDHPVLWASLAHETGGHDVLHADEGLLPELAAGVYALFGGAPIKTGTSLTMAQFLGLLWSYWIDEAASDVYGLLNIGPTFGLNLAAFFSALNSPRGKGRPSLRTDSGADEQGWLDPHPTDIVRLHLARGATQAERGLSASVRNAYAADLERLAALCGGGAQSVRLQGAIAISHDRALSVNTQVPLAAMQDAASRVGDYIATVKLKALDNHSIQDIETWDDADEGSAVGIATALKGGEPISGMGDDAQLLAGATLALLDDPTRYDRVTRTLDDALDNSFELDPIWGRPRTDRSHIVTAITARYAPRRGWLANVTAKGRVRTSKKR